MQDKPQYIYIMYPLPIEEAENLPLPFKREASPPKIEYPSEDFVPLWFGNAKFPEDEE